MNDSLSLDLNKQKPMTDFIATDDEGSSEAADEFKQDINFVKNIRVGIINSLTQNGTVIPENIAKLRVLKEVLMEMDSTTVAVKRVGVDKSAAQGNIALAQSIMAVLASQKAEPLTRDLPLVERVVPQPNLPVYVPVEGEAVLNVSAEDYHSFIKRTSQS